MKTRDSAETRVLIIFPGALGDLICLMPAIRWIAEQNSRASLELMARTELARFAEGRVGIARAHSIDRLEVSHLFGEGATDLSRARDFFDAFDRIYSFFAADNRSFKANLSAIARVVHFYSFRPPGDGHVAKAYLEAIGAPGDSATARKIELRNADRLAASVILTRLGLRLGEYLLVLPGSGSQSKNWPVAKFVELATHSKIGMASSFGAAQDKLRSFGFAGLHSRAQNSGQGVSVTPVVVLGPAEGGIADRFRAVGMRVLEDLELGTVAALANGARAFIGNDSGVSHLAAASGAPGVVLFGPTDPERWCPHGKVTAIRHQPLADLPVAKVAAALHTVLC